MSQLYDQEENNERITTLLAKDLYAICELSTGDEEQLRLLVLDFIAAALAGYRENREFNEAVEKTVLPQGGTGESTILFCDKKHPARTAAFMNSVYGHGAELDDGNKKAAGHAGVHLIPAIFALAEKTGSSNKEVLEALAVGYEAYIRISSAAMPGMIKRGFHSTGMAGTIAVAAACAKLLRLDAQGIEDSMALATTMTGGLLSYGDSRPAIKPLNPGKAAESGLLAAMLASEGVKGPSQALEGHNGWFHAVTESFDEKCLRGSDHLLLHDCYFKLYPSCRHTHCGIDAACSLHERVRPEDIKEIIVYIYPAAISLAGIRMPKDKDETKFSICYTVARAILTGSYGLSDMKAEEFMPETAVMIEKITLVPDDSMEDRERGIRGARVEVVDNSGNTYTETVLVPKGDPENPVTREDIENKLINCAGDSVSGPCRETLLEMIGKIRGSDTFINPMRAITESNSLTYTRR